MRRARTTTSSRAHADHAGAGAPRSQAGAEASRITIRSTIHGTPGRAAERRRCRTSSGSSIPKRSDERDADPGRRPGRAEDTQGLMAIRIMAKFHGHDRIRRAAVPVAARRARPSCSGCGSGGLYATGTTGNGFQRHRRVPVARTADALRRAPVLAVPHPGALASTVVARARPTAAVPLVRSAGVDVIVLQDGSASMHVRDVGANRWQRSMQFLRTLGESLRWKDDRIALALFAHVAEPQVRLTKDPNTYFFFLDHLYRESPFRLEDDPTWDTNIEQGVYWGVRLHREGRGASREIAERQSVRPRFGRSGVERRGGQRDAARPQPGRPDLRRRRRDDQRRPDPGAAKNTSDPKAAALPPPRLIHSSLDRESLAAIATAGGGQYLELGRQSDRDIANRIISATRRRAGAIGIETAERELYWQFLFAAAVMLLAGVVFMQERSELWLSAVGASAALFVVWRITTRTEN